MQRPTDGFSLAEAREPRDAIPVRRPL